LESGAPAFASRSPSIAEAASAPGVPAEEEVVAEDVAAIDIDRKVESAPGPGVVLSLARAAGQTSSIAAMGSPPTISEPAEPHRRLQILLRCSLT
jgi:hypothetical protein